MQQNDYGSRISVLESRLSEYERRQHHVEEKVDRILSIVSEAKGGWRVMVILGGAAGVVGAFIGKWLATVVSVMPK